MLVYGDHSELADPRERLSSLSTRLAAVAAMPPGIERHAALVAVLVEAGRLLQGVADAGAPSDGLDQFVYRLAQATVRSWDSRFADVGDLPDVPVLGHLGSVELRLPEGFAFYAVYPEHYLEAARRLTLTGPARVIGIRSIGTTLGAIVAAALDAPPPITIRPTGDPFARSIDLAPDLVDGDAHYVIVDEGPGLSGSSFGAVADALEARGVPLERIAFLPSHAGDLGRQASSRHRERWELAQRVPAEFDPDFLTECLGPLREFRTGHPWERRKFLARLEGAPVLVKFAGLGAIGERKLDMAQALHATGLTPEPVGLTHGFLVERWCEDSAALGPCDRPVEEIGGYIGTRARLFPADETSGASLDDLLAMCRRNVALTIGEDAAKAIHLPEVRRLSRVRTDNKLDRGEWLRSGDGRLLKTDALDHHCGHDLIGCQDMAWDIAGAIVEFDLDAEEGSRLIGTAELAAEREVDRELLAFYRLAYCCFRLGAALLAGESCAGTAEADRLESTASKYRTAVQALLNDL